MILNSTQPEHLGAEGATNNTAELSAVHHALSGARELRRPEEAVLILSDSQLAICTTTGAWASHKHKALVARNRKALSQLRAEGAEVRIQHVRAHTGQGMNERADELAAQGAQGMCEGATTPSTSRSTSGASRRTQCQTESQGVGRAGKGGE